MSNSAWCDFNSKADILKLYDICSKNSNVRNKLLLLQGNFNWRDLDLEAR